MTAVPIPRSGTFVENGRESEGLFMDIRKNLEKDFATPQVVQKHLSRLSSQAYIASSSCMKVFLRIRPFTEEETRRKENQHLMEISDDCHALTLKPPNGSSISKNAMHTAGDSIHTFSFTKIFSESVGQKEFFDETTLPIIQKFVEGQNSLVFTYGVTSSGKTYTIQGSPGNEGIMPRSVDVIFNSLSDQILQDSDLQLEQSSKVVRVSREEKQKLVEEKTQLLELADKIQEMEGLPKDSLEPALESSIETVTNSAESSIAEAKSTSRLSFLDFTRNVTDDSIVDLTSQGQVRFVLFVSFIEIYKDYIYDLLQPLPKGKNKKRTALRLAENKNVPFVKGLRQVQVSSREEVFKLLTVGRNHLHIAETKLNHNSSRSHCIFTIKTVCVGDPQMSNAARVSQMSFCDLAGSERWGKTSSFGERLKEAGKINTSLMTLGKCLETVRYNQQHTKQNQRVVPYRESRLTRLFQNFLVGHGKACMIVNANQCASMYGETLHVLKFSAIASEVRVEPNLARKSTRISSRQSHEKLSVSLNRALTRTESRTTSSWQPAEKPIREEESEDDDEETRDPAYWEERETKLFRVITLLKEAVKQEKEKVFEIEAEVRMECAQEMRQRFVEIEENFEERMETRVKSVEDMGEAKYSRTVDLANATIERLHNEKAELAKEVEELEKECDELEEKVEELSKGNLTKSNESEASKEGIEELQESLKAKDAEILELKRQMSQNPRSSTFTEQEAMIENLQKENDDGREIIQEQLKEMEEMKLSADEFQRTAEQLSDKLQCSENEAAKLKETNTGLLGELDARKNDLNKMTSDLEKSESSVSRLESTVADLKAEFEKSKVELAAVESELEKARNDLAASRSASDHIQSDAATATEKISSLETELSDARSKLEVATSETEKLREDLLQAQNKMQQLETSVELNKEIVVAEITELKSEAEQMSLKNKELTKTVEEALYCAELKNSEVEKLIVDVETSNAKCKKLEDEIRSKMEEKDEEHKKEMQSSTKEHQRELLKLQSKLTAQSEENSELTKELSAANTLQSQLIAETERLQSKLEQAKRDSNVSKKEQDKRSSINTEQAQDLRILTIERDDLLVKVDSLDKELNKIMKEKQKLEDALPTLNVAEASELEKLKETLAEMDKVQTEQQQMLEKYEEEKKMTERNETELTRQLDELTKKKEELSSDLETLKEARDDAETSRSGMAESLRRSESTIRELNATIAAFEKEKLRNEKKEMELKEKSDKLTKENQSLTCELDTLKKSRGDGEASKSRMAESLNESESKLSKMKKTVQDLEQKMEEREEKEKSDTKIIQRKEKEIKSLQQEVERANESKVQELKKFREGRDRIATALETQINSQKSCSEALKEKLNDQILTNVQLKSENSRLKAELQQRNNSPAKTLRKSVSASVLLQPIKAEVLSPLANPHSFSPPGKLREAVVVMHDMSSCGADFLGASAPQPAEVVKCEASDQATSEITGPSSDPEEIQTKKTSRSSKRSTRTSRQPVVKKTSSRRKRGALSNRPATPIASDVLEDFDDAPPKPRRRRTTRAKSSIDNNIVKSETNDTSDSNDVTLQVLDDSDLLRATGNSREFPKPEIEMDVTPQLKKSTRGPKKTARVKEEPSRPQTSDDEQENQRQTRARRRGRGPAAKDTSDDRESSLNRFKSISRVGDLLKNSPVGQALKRFEAAISPSRPPSVISSPANSGFHNDQTRQSTRKVRKLHAEDISLPLECTPKEQGTIGAAGKGVGVLSQTQNVGPSSRRLRRRK